MRKIWKIQVRTEEENLRVRISEMGLKDQKKSSSMHFASPQSYVFPCHGSLSHFHPHIKCFGDVSERKH
jgi:hypothetical protein